MAFQAEEGTATAPPGSSFVTTVSPGGTLNYLSKWTPSGTELGNSPFYDNGGQIGLGLTATTAKFHIKGTGDLQKIVDSSDANVILLKSDGSMNLGANAFSPTSNDANIRYRYSNTTWNVGGLYMGADIQVHTSAIRNGDIRMGASDVDALSCRIMFWADNSGAGEYTYGGQIYCDPAIGRMNIRGGLDGLDILGGTSATLGLNVHPSGFIGIRAAGSNTTSLLIAAGTTGVSQIRLSPGVAPTSPVDGDVYYVDTNDRLMFRKNATDVEVLSASAKTTEVIVPDTSITVTFNGASFKISALAI